MSTDKQFPEKDRRRSPRHTTRRIVLIVDSRGVADGDTIDMSLEGFGGAIDGDFKVGDEVFVYINGDEKHIKGRKAKIVRRIPTGGLGFEFLPEKG